MEEKSNNYLNKFFTVKYIVGYLIVAIVVYGLIYFMVKGRNGGYGGSGYGEPPPPPPDSVVSQQNQLVVVLSEENSSGQSGMAILTGENGKTNVAITLSGSSEATQPAHIHSGNCPGVGAVKYPLTSVSGGRSDTTLDVTLEKLRSELPLAINVHKSEKEAKIYVSCGQIQ